jgi:cytochrome c553
MRKISVALVVFLIVAAFVLAACSSQSSGSGAGDVANGKKLYNSATLGTNSSPGCVSCHNYDASKGKNDKAPYTAGTAVRSEARVAGMSGADYIKESILKPDAYVVEGFKAGDMYKNWAKELNDQQIADLVAYLVTEK